MTEILLNFECGLPTEIIQYICSYLKLTDIMALMISNKKISDQVGTECFWYSLFIRDFGRKPNNVFKYKLEYAANLKVMTLSDDKLECAIKNNYPQKVKDLMSKTKFQLLREEKDYLLMILCVDNGLDMLNSFFENEWNNKENRDYLLYWAAEKGKIKICEQLLKYKADINFNYQNNFSPLYAAAEGGYINICKLLIHNNAVIDIKTRHGITPLYIAAQTGRTDIVEYLTALGADIESSNRGFTPLFVASKQNHLSTVTLLLKLGANANSCDGDGSTPLYVACQNGYPDIVQELINYKADQNICYTGYSPLYIACQNGFDLIVKILCNSSIYSKVNIDKIFPNGRTAADIAANRGHINCVKELMINRTDCK